MEQSQKKRYYLILTLDDTKDERWPTNMMEHEPQLAYALQHLGFPVITHQQYRDLWIEIPSPLTSGQVRALFQLKDESALMCDFQEAEIDE